MPAEGHLAFAWRAKFLRVPVTGVDGVNDHAWALGVADAIDRQDACIAPFGLALAQRQVQRILG